MPLSLLGGDKREPGLALPHSRTPLPVQAAKAEAQAGRATTKLYNALLSPLLTSPGHSPAQGPPQPRSQKAGAPKTAAHIVGLPC